MRTNIYIELDVDDKQLARDFLTLQHRLSNSGLETFMEESVDPYLKQRVESRFAAEGDDAVGMWLALSQRTVQIRQALGYGGAHPINVRTRDMLNYLLHSSPDILGSAISTELIFPSRGGPASVMEKIETAQSGKPLPPTPPRPVIALSDADDKEIIGSLADYIMTGLVGGVI